MSRLVVLNYHGLFHQSPREYMREDRLYAIGKRSFERQLQILSEERTHILSLEQMRLAKDDLLVAITIDDGKKSDIDIAAGLLLKYGFSATFFPTVSGLLGRDCGYSDIHQLIDHKFSIGSHGWFHRSLRGLPPEEQKREIMDSRDWFSQAVGVHTKFFAPPYGEWDPSMMTMAREAGYEAICLTGRKVNQIQPETDIVFRCNVKPSWSEEIFRDIVRGEFTFGIWSRMKDVAVKKIGAERITKLRSHLNV